MCRFVIASKMQKKQTLLASVKYYPWTKARTIKIIIKWQKNPQAIVLFTTIPQSTVCTQQSAQ